jgi:homoserine/homoserine lactone efflux protein
MPLKIWLLFIATTGLVCLTPGVAALLVVAQGISKGMRRSYWAIAGIALANAIYFALSATGLAALVVASHAVFNAVKWAGVAYLVYLGIRALFNRSSALAIKPADGTPVSGPRALSQGLMVELANPKALLFFVALLPQFVDVHRPIWSQMLIFGLTTVLLDLGSYSFYAWLGAKSQGVAANRKWAKTASRATGVVLIAAGALTAFAKA